MRLILLCWFPTWKRKLVDAFIHWFAGPAPPTDFEVMPFAVEDAAARLAATFKNIGILGIRQDADGYAALLKEESSDEIRRVRAGDTFAAVHIKRITPDGILGIFDDQTFELRLDGARP